MKSFVSGKYKQNRDLVKSLSGFKIDDSGNITFENKGTTIVLFDTETSGLNPDKDRVVQFSAIKYLIEDGKISEIDRLDQYIDQPQYDPDKPLGGDKVDENGEPMTFGKLTGITRETLDGQPEEPEAFKIINNFLGPNPIIGAYNTPFDYKFMVQMYIRNGAIFNVQEEDALDVLIMARDIVSKEESSSHKLGDIANLYGLDKGVSFHSAIDDIYVTGLLLNTFMSQYYDFFKAEATKPPVVIERAKVQSLSYWQGYRGFSRIYINAILKGVSVSYFYDIRNKSWGEKDEGTIIQTDMPLLMQDAFDLAGVATEEEFAKIDKTIKADPTFLSRYSI